MSVSLNECVSVSASVASLKSRQAAFEGCRPSVQQVSQLRVRAHKYRNSFPTQVEGRPWSRLSSSASLSLSLTLPALSLAEMSDEVLRANTIWGNKSNMCQLQMLLDIELEEAHEGSTL